MASHTPGPWNYSHHKGLNEHLVGVTLRNVAIVEHRHEDAGECPAGTTEANARLIAAAPTMLDALESLIGLVEELVPEHDDIGEQGHDPENCSICEARIAIRKATEE